MIKIILSTAFVPAFQKLFPGIQIKNGIGGIFNAVTIQYADIDPASAIRWEEFNQRHEQIAQKSFHRSCIASK
jgi:hypothetical protein